MLKLKLPAVLAGIALTFVSALPAVAQGQAGGHYDFFAQRMTDPPELWQSLLGKKAPDVRLQTLDGDTFDLASYTGKKIVVLDFWATWCPPCRILMPAIAEALDAYKDKDVVFYTVNASDPPEYIKRFLETNGLDLKVALDEGGSVSEAYLVDTIPRLVIIDKDKTIQSIHGKLEGRSVQQVQSNAKKRLAEELDKLLAGEKLVKPEPAKPGESTMEARKETPEK